MHTPVLLQEVLQALDPRPGDFMVDGTVDGGGHAAAIINTIGPTGRFLGLDLDAEMAATCRSRLPKRSGVDIVAGNYADLAEILTRYDFGAPDGLLLDLGFSSEQLAQSGRGFSFREASRNEPLLMTYDDERTSVRDILRVISEQDLADIIFRLGGERYARRIARAIVAARRKRPLRTSGDLAEVIRAALPRGYERGRIDPATRTFQALRIAANGELENLERILAAVPDIMAPGGRVAIISFHSLEDRIVKQAFRTLVQESRMELITKKPILASSGEIAENPRSRSAKLRAGKILSVQH
jgi:16S rRNA (cytosine1402-N4)-methyltransferase